MYLTPALGSWLFMYQASSLVLPWESYFRDGGPGIDFINPRHTCARVLRYLIFVSVCVCLPVTNPAKASLGSTLKKGTLGFQLVD